MENKVTICDKCGNVVAKGKCDICGVDLCENCGFAVGFVHQEYRNAAILQISRLSEFKDFKGDNMVLLCKEHADVFRGFIFNGSITDSVKRCNNTLQKVIHDKIKSEMVFEKL